MKMDLSEMYGHIICACKYSLTLAHVSIRLAETLVSHSFRLLNATVTELSATTLTQKQNT